MLYPKKNLIPPLKDYDFSKAGSVYTAPPGSYWLSSFAPSQTDYVTFKSEYYFETTASGNNRDVIVLVPAKPNTAYKPSCDTNADIHLMYYDDKRAKITQTYNTISANVAGVTPAGCAFIGFVLTNRGLGPGTYYFKNWQLEEVATATSPATPFEPYQLTNKRAAVRKDIIAPDILGTSHNFVSGNVYKVKQDVRLTKAKFESLTAGSFNVAIYEWVEGTGKVGNALFQRDADYGTGVYSYDFGGITLKAGKSYFIGRYDQTNAAAIKRITGASINVGNYVEWVGGTTLSQTTIIYPTSYYSFFAIEFELIKPAVMSPAKNLLPDSSGWETGSINGVDGVLLVNVSRLRTKDLIPVTPNKKYKLDFNPACMSEVYFYNDSGYVGKPYNWSYGPNDINVPSNATYIRVLLRYPNDKALQPSEINIMAPVLYDPNILVNKPAKLISDGALNVPLTSDLWVLRSGTTYKRFEGNRVYWNSNADYAGIQLILANMGYKDSDFQGKDIVFGGDVHPLATVMFYYKKSDGTPTYIGVSKVTDNGARAMNIPYGSTEHRIYVQSDAGGRGELWCENVYVKFGTEKGIKPYNPTNKKAVLYPQKNLFTFEGCKITSGGGSSFTVISPNEVIVSSVLNAFTAIETVKMTVKPNTQYTISYEVEHITGIDPPRVSPRKGSDRSGITLTDGAGSKTMTFNTGSETEIYFLLYANLADVSAPQSNRYKRVQVEEGTQTPFEPYRLGNKRA
ncbi:tail protein [Bacillus phage Pavlov]|uniref:tail protein n=1 Tax=Bacillus phage Pavlov TaxID=1675598 RepID=UPI00065F2B1F|nr:tail protein [Bacillus phage Pavlov]AKQ07431.1 hypothetical protein CPT_Pavlov10 [Bacillus phage Pavlov]